MQMTSGFIAVHAGAGYHSPDKEKAYRAVCKDACKQAMEILKNEGSALAAITRAVSILEDSPLTNAGVGSNLTLDGSVECDASVMDGNALMFGAVGCITDVQNPVQVARHLVDTQRQGCLPLGRIPPSVLVGTGARQWAEEQHLKLTKRAGLITEASKRTYVKYKKKLDRCGTEMVGSATKRATKEGDVASTSKEQTTTESGISPPDTNKLEGSGESSTGSSSIQDTVGAVSIDRFGNMAAASSSGGIWLKHKGRLGPAAHYGAGCWADNGDGDSISGIAVVTSGGGEHLMRTLFAKSCAERVQSAENASLGVSSAFKDNFLESRFLQHIDDKHGGVLVLKQQGHGVTREVEVLWAHTTDSMCVGYQLHSHSKPTTFVSRLPVVSIPGKSFTMEGKCFRIGGSDTDSS